MHPNKALNTIQWRPILTHELGRPVAEVFWVL